MVTTPRPQSQFSMRLVSLRQHSCLSRQQVALWAGISVDLVQSIEQGRTGNPTVDTVFGLAQALEVSYQELMDGIAADRAMERARSSPDPEVHEAATPA